MVRCEAVTRSGKQCYRSATGQIGSKHFCTQHLTIVRDYQAENAGAAVESYPSFESPPVDEALSTFMMSRQGGGARRDFAHMIGALVPRKTKSIRDWRAGTSKDITVPHTWLEVLKEDPIAALAVTLRTDPVKLMNKDNHNIIPEYPRLGLTFLDKLLLIAVTKLPRDKFVSLLTLNLGNGSLKTIWPLLMMLNTGTYKGVVVPSPHIDIRDVIDNYRYRNAPDNMLFILEHVPRNAFPRDRNGHLTLAGERNDIDVVRALLAHEDYGDIGLAGVLYTLLIEEEVDYDSDGRLTTYSFKETIPNVEIIRLIVNAGGGNGMKRAFNNYKLIQNATERNSALKFAAYVRRKLATL